ncbi:MAG: hypothetical protein KDB21_07540 [Acidimicrobiales bacterium]|nr:hypothetical protein [Acidimicrobiales bacterium]
MKAPTWRGLDPGDPLVALLHHRADSGDPTSERWLDDIDAGRSNLESFAALSALDDDDVELAAAVIGRSSSLPA